VGTNKFCIKEWFPGASSCGTSRHEVPKFDGLFGHCYVKYNEIQAHCSPCLDAETFSSKQLDSLAARWYTLTEWVNIFGSIAAGDFPEWLPKELIVDTQGDAEPFPTFQQLSILSPTAGLAMLFDYKPSLSFDSVDSSVLVESGDQAPSTLPWRNQVVPPELLSHDDKIAGGPKKVKLAWLKPLQDIEAGYKLVVADLCTMHNNVQTLHSTLEVPAPLGDSTRTVWDPLEYLHVAYVDLAASTADLEEKVLETLTDHLSNIGIPDNFTTFSEELQTGRQQFEACLVSMENLLCTHTDRFNYIRPILE
jgi:hypothetical protein